METQAPTNGNVGTAVADYHDRDAWLAERRTGIGGSEVAALFGEHPFVSRLDLYRRKVGEFDEEPQNLQMLRGQMLEPIAAERYEQETGRQTRRQPLRRHPVHDFLICSVDRQILAGDDNETGPLELKVPGYQVFTEIRRQGLRPYMLLQGQHEALVWDYDYTGFGILHADSFKLLHFDVEADPEVQTQIIEAAGNFWNDHVIPRKPPQDDAPAPDIKVPEGVGAEITQAPERREQFLELMDARDVRDEATKLYNEVAGILKKQLEVGGFETDGVRVYKSIRPGRKTLDKKAIAAAGLLDPMEVVQALAAIDPQIPTVSLLEECVADLSVFDKIGAPYEELRPYRVRGGSNG